MSKASVLRACNPVTAWGVYNFGSALRGTFYTRKAAKLFCEEEVGEPWDKCRAYFQIRKVIVTPVSKP
jgi:hypothetical protein